MRLRCLSSITSFNYFLSCVPEAGYLFDLRAFAARKSSEPHTCLAMKYAFSFLAYMFARQQLRFLFVLSLCRSDLSCARHGLLALEEGRKRTS